MRRYRARAKALPEMEKAAASPTPHTLLARRHLLRLTCSQTTPRPSRHASSGPCQWRRQEVSPQHCIGGCCGAVPDMAAANHFVTGFRNPMSCWEVANRFVIIRAP